MTSGWVTEDLKVKINVPVSVDGSAWSVLEAVIDTGFNGQLAFPEETILTLGLALGRSRRVTPAIGETRVVASGYIQLRWNGIPRPARVIQAGIEPLIGMALLQNHRITIDAIANGPVTITPLP